MVEGYPVFLTDTCVGCNMCVEVCPTMTLKVDPQTKVVAYANRDNCIFCGHCAAICPSSTISMFGVTPESEEKAMKADPPAIRAIKMARTCRKYHPEPLPKDDIMKVISIAKYSASSSNVRPLHFTVLSRGTMDTLGLAIAKEVSRNPKYAKVAALMEKGIDVVFRGAPHMLLMSAPADKAAVAMADASIAGRDIQLNAESMGLGMFWCGFLLAAVASSQELHDGCGVPEGHKILMAMGLGRPKIKFARPALRRDLEEGIDITFK
ncbi:Nitroreductase Fd-NR2 [Giardia duodenalis]|uniref:nitroreductase Fd-NR2 n=2 Tax=Giardia intestinalis TaxID=5741 RepID=V6TWM2_GIAIN|nr:Nitroreductase Fd-NR2 [Giardia intestinalis ATCC 50581]ESU41415.1 Nitroreductase Fd-NR2 [Giardia intestinalis]QBO59733.1 nitroreductase fd-NR2 [Giardia intestinalis]QBO59734.1 nitroreductase fd-NR2 [Giardia intestinalis]QBO59735.1 nitroreductase fd-NR2 [Giardia intestinalis]